MRLDRLVKDLTHPMSLLVYTEKNSPRIDYIFHLMIEDIAGFSFGITSSKEEFETFQGPKISYGYFFSKDTISIPNAGFLESKDKEIHSLAFVQHNGILCPFSMQEAQWDFSFDLFSAAFYLVTRCEEYSGKGRDHHDRFSAYESIAYKKSFLEKPVVNYWALELRKKIRDKYPTVDFKSNQSQVIATIDIDQLFAIKARGIKRTVGRLWKNLLSNDIESIVQTCAVLVGSKEDPFQTFDYILSLNEKSKNELIFFVHLGDYGTYDKSIRWNHEGMKQTLQKVISSASLGIHPSYRSHQSVSAFETEMNRYTALLQQAPQKSRQHYLKLNLPQTYETLIDLGIKEDYTMGYSECVGYRASISTPFYFYNLNTEEKTGLKVYPFAIMDRALKDGMKLSVSQSIDKIKELRNDVVSTEGLLVLLFHNESLSENKEWKGWRKVYEAALTA